MKMILNMQEILVLHIVCYPVYTKISTMLSPHAGDKLICKKLGEKLDLQCHVSLASRKCVKLAFCSVCYTAVHTHTHTYRCVVSLNTHDLLMNQEVKACVFSFDHLTFRIAL